jgi:hypothetical protein
MQKRVPDIDNLYTEALRDIKASIVAKKGMVDKMLVADKNPATVNSVRFAGTKPR